jgi:hypothetical protein
VASSLYLSGYVMHSFVMERSPFSSALDCPIRLEANFPPRDVSVRRARGEGRVRERVSQDGGFRGRAEARVSYADHLTDKPVSLLMNHFPGICDATYDISA